MLFMCKLRNKDNKRNEWMGYICQLNKIYISKLYTRYYGKSEWVSERERGGGRGGGERERKCMYSHTSP